MLNNLTVFVTDSPSVLNADCLACLDLRSLKVFSEVLEEGGDCQMLSKADTYFLWVFHFNHKPVWRSSYL